MRKPSIKQSAIRPPADQNPWARGEQPWRTRSEQSRTEVQAAKGSSDPVGGGPPLAALRMKCSTAGLLCAFAPVYWIINEGRTDFAHAATIELRHQTAA